MGRHHKLPGRTRIATVTLVAAAASATVGATVLHLPDADAHARKPATYTRVIAKVPTWRTLAYAPTEDSVPRNAHGTLAYQHAKWYDRRTGQAVMLGVRVEDAPMVPRDPRTGLFLDYRSGAWVAQR